MGTRAGRTQEDVDPAESDRLPAVTFLNQEGKEIAFRSLPDAGKTVIVDFISTSCTVICPELSAGYSALRDELGEAARSVRLVSISIDPESDTPEKMKDYLARYNSGEGWDFLTGSREDIALVLKAMNVTHGASPDGKIMPPRSMYALRGPKSNGWMLINGRGGSSGLKEALKELEKETELYAYTNAKANESVADYEEYVTCYPAGAHLEEIKQLLNDLKNSSTEDLHYAEATDRNDFQAYKEYLRKFPHGRYAAEITALLNKSHGATPEFIAVKGGCYRMGDQFREGGTNEKPVHEVCLDDFAMGKYAVTVGEFKQFVSDTGYVTEAEKGGGCYDWTLRKNGSLNWRNAGFAQDDRHPVVCVSWNDSVAFAEWVSAKTGKKYRLPSEAEWEYAARSGGKDENFPGFSARGQLCLYANFCDNSCLFEQKTATQDDGYKFSAPVGSYAPNGLGLHDMAGNVLQWTNDWYGQTYYKESPKANPAGPDSGRYRVLRGGSWSIGNPLYMRATYRLWGTPAVRFHDIGFRLVRDEGVDR
ncbi:MAG: SUMF1/EgtB/PvdO family nonheme iron enzyme [Syntrophobacteraceae bacterium]